MDTGMAHIGLMWKQCHEGNEQFTTCIETDRVQDLLLQHFRNVVQCLDQLEHSAG